MTVNTYNNISNLHPTVGCRIYEISYIQSVFKQNDIDYDTCILLPMHKNSEKTPEFIFQKGFYIWDAVMWPDLVLIEYRFTIILCIFWFVTFYWKKYLKLLYSIHFICTGVTERLHLLNFKYSWQFRIFLLYVVTSTWRCTH